MSLKNNKNKNSQKHDVKELGVALSFAALMLGFVMMSTIALKKEKLVQTSLIQEESLQTAIREQKDNRELIPYNASTPTNDTAADDSSDGWEEDSSQDDSSEFDNSSKSSPSTSTSSNNNKPATTNPAASPSAMPVTTTSTQPGNVSQPSSSSVPSSNPSTSTAKPATASQTTTNNQSRPSNPPEAGVSMELLIAISLAIGMLSTGAFIFSKRQRHVKNF